MMALAVMLKFQVIWLRKDGTSQKYDGNKVKEKAYVASYVGDCSYK